MFFMEADQGARDIGDWVSRLHFVRLPNTGNTNMDFTNLTDFYDVL